MSETRGTKKAQRLESKPIFDGRVVKLSLDRVRLPNGNVTDLELIRHPGAAAVVPVDASGQVVLVRQYRYATSGWLLEVPAGKLDPNEPPEHCAAREVEEETGFRPQTLVSMGWIWTTPGFTDEKIWLFLGRKLTRGNQQLQTDELLEVVKLPLRDAIRQAADGTIRDGKSICALLRTAQGAFF